MKTVIIFILSTLLLTGCVSKSDHSLFVTLPSETTTVETIDESTITTTVEAIHESTITTVPTQPSHWAYYDPDISVENAITWFSEVCLAAEMVNGGDATLIQKWDVPIYYYINGDPTDEDLIALQNFEAWINTVEGFPGMYPTVDLGQANLKIYFCTQQELLNIMGPNFGGLDGAVTYWYEDNAIYNANICIRTDLSQHLRNSVIKEELYNGLGPINDTSLREDSIIFAGYSEPQELTATDKLIMALLYDPSIQCGMNADQCAEIIRNIYC